MGILVHYNRFYPISRLNVRDDNCIMKIIKYFLYFIGFCFIAILTLAFLAPGNDNLPVLLVVLIPALFLSVLIITIKRLFY